ncbi:hypothetical protein [Corynebacterium anserum]|uniref:Uncharacterized protein n=1 Tax=Corynebacterium anserum TaxID=2684406 RepID=A0A7G7YNL0_9CORY|nr:hypothetical protein [Corynebacterium anserum]MBC2681656.1 hypothetical protein [Corynebacterium anserum]QNH96080.1 hypothetical protein GP473_04840 [Corynebacterium anserum]
MISMPTWVVVTAVVLVIVALLGLWAMGTANRLNRLHIRTDAARINLEGALAARGHVIKALYPQLTKEVMNAEIVPLRAVDMGHRTDSENHVLSLLPTEIFHNPAFVEASTRVDIAARFYNDAVANTLAVRKRPDVRLLRLAGNAPLPKYYEALSAGE